MAVYLPVISGVLAALAAWGLLAGDAARASADDVRQGAAAVLERAAAAIGARLPAGVIACPGAEAALAVAARIAQRAVPRAGADARVAAGCAVLILCAGGFAGWVLAASPAGVPIGCVATAAALAIAGARDRRAQGTLVAETMPEAFHALSISLGSGHSLEQALRFVGNHAQEPIRTEFMRASFAMSCGVPASEALDELLGRLPAPGLDLVALALKVSQRTGAPLKDLLAQAASMVGERIELARRLEVKTAQARMSARLVTAMPLAMVAGLAMLSPDFRAGVATPVGAACIAAALALDAAAWVIIHRIMEVRI